MIKVLLRKRKVCHNYKRNLLHFVGQTRHEERVVKLIFHRALLSQEAVEHNLCLHGLVHASKLGEGAMPVSVVECTI